jgi:hypothetical protein
LPVILKARCVLEYVFRGVERQVSFVILFGGLDCAKAHCHIFLTGTEETPDPYHCRLNLAALVDQKIHDLTELLIVLVVNILRKSRFAENFFGRWSFSGGCPYALNGWTVCRFARGGGARRWRGKASVTAITGTARTKEMIDSAHKIALTNVRFWG